MKTQTIAIVGLGRLGASIGLAIKASAQELTVIGHDKDRDAGQKALELGAIDKAESNLFSAASAADILILVTSLADLEATFAAIGDAVQPHALVLDMVSLKGPGLKLAKTYLHSGHHVGVSPVLSAAFLSDSRYGLEAASADMFRQSVFCLMPSPKAEPKAVETAVNLGRLLGAMPFFLDALEYDSLVQGVETVPGLVAAAIFRTVVKSSGWRDILRITGLPFALATHALANEDLAQLTLYNQEATLRWLDAVLSNLQEVRKWVQEGDEERLSLILEDLAVGRRRWLREREENNWTEDASGVELGELSLGRQLFGIGGRGLGKRKES